MPPKPLLFIPPPPRVSCHLFRTKDKSNDIVLYSNSNAWNTSFLYLFIDFFIFLLLTGADSKAGGAKIVHGAITTIPSNAPPPPRKLNPPSFLLGCSRKRSTQHKHGNTQPKSASKCALLSTTSHTPPVIRIFLFLHSKTTPKYISCSPTILISTPERQR